MSSHLTDHDRFLQGALSGESAAEVARHLAECPHCAAAARASESAARATDALATSLLGAGDEHPPVETLLTGYVDGMLDPGEADLVAAHLQRCPRCREDFADLRSIADAMQRPAHDPVAGTERPGRGSRRAARRLALAAAALIGVAAAMLLVVRKPSAPSPPVRPTAPPQVVDRQVPPPPAPERPMHAEWRAALDRAVRDGAVAMPATLAALLRDPEVLRSGTENPAARLEPAGAIVETTRPRFTWPATPGSTYMVSLFENDQLILQSDVLNEAAWQLARDLARGRTYQWEVDILTGEETRTLPAPPAPPALFRVLDRSAHEELERASAEHGDDPLLLGVLYARHGLRTDAERELRRVQTEEGRRLLRSIEAWPR